MKKENAPYLSLAFLTGLNLFNYLDRYVLPSVLTPLQTDLHLSAGDAGRANTAFMIGYFVTSPFFGYLGDRFSRKWLIALGIFVWSLGTTLSAFATGLGMLLAFRILVGLGEASYATLSPAWLSDLFPPAKRNNALTVFYVAIPVGSALGFIAGGLVLGHADSWPLLISLKQLCAHMIGTVSTAGNGDWRPAFLLAGAPGLLLALGLLFLREPKRGETEASEVSATASHAKPTLADVARLFRIADFNLLLVGYTAYTFALGAFGFWAAKFLNQVHGVKYENADHFFGLTLVVTGLVATLAGGLAATAWQRHFRAGYATLLVCSVALAVPVATMAFLTENTLLSQVFLALSMFLLFLPTGPTNTLIVESVPVMLRASAMAVSIFVIHLFGDLWSPEIVGRLSDAWAVGGHPEAGLRRAVLILPMVLTIAAAFWGWLAWRQAHDLTSAQTEKTPPPLP